MHKINTETATQNGEFTDGDELQSIAPTDLNAAWFNSVQRELCNIVTEAGGSLDPSNDAQLWATLKKIGIRCLYSDDAEVDVTGFSGATVIFHSAENFELVGSLSSQSFVVIVPFWADSSPDEITVEYNTSSIDINKHWMFVGFAANGLDGLQLAGTYLPMASSEDLGGSITVGGVNAGFVKAAKSFEIGIVDFQYTEDQEELQGQQVWQLAENWQVNQVKRVRCTNAPSGGVQVATFRDTSGTFNQVNFYPGSFRELMCVGTYTNGGYTWAVLNVDGRP